MRGAFIQVVNPTIILENAGKPVYSFQTDELHILAVSLFASILLEDCCHLSILPKHTDHFPYCSGGQKSIIHLTFYPLENASFLCEIEGSE
jgi:aminopeptidase-like protein